MIKLLLLVPLFPLIGFLINGIFGKSLSKSLSGILACTTLFLSFLVSVLAFLELNGSKTKEFIIPVFDWIQTGTLDIPLSLFYDPLSALMILIITGVGFLIHWYSTSYMKEDEGFSRYFAYLNLFVFFMLILVLGSGYVSMFIGWEGVGLCSYLLIGFWFKNTSYNNAAKKAFIMNRIGDLGFLIGIYLIIMVFGSEQYREVNKGLMASSSSIPEKDLILIGVFLFIGAMGKSAQIPLFTWLPDAMAGPTPVSALIHAATMVTAGIYMVVRTNILYSLIPGVQEFIAIIGAATLLLGALIALTQNDIKKILAYSTVSQLGYMFMGLGVGAYSSSLFHVLTHAFFKALLFLGAGSVIHAMGGEQDIRKMGFLRKKMPLTYFSMLIGTLAISGFPPFSGFFSKDAILSHVYESNKVLWGLGVLGAAFTAFYMFRMLFITFFGSFRGTHDQEHHLHESPGAITYPLLILALLATIAGFIGIPEFIVPNANFLEKYLSPVIQIAGTPLREISHPGIGLEWTITLVTLLVVFISTGFAWFSYGKGQVPAEDTAPRKWLPQLSYHKFYIDEFYTLLIVTPIEWLSLFFYKVVDRKWIDGWVNGLGKDFLLISNGTRKWQSGNVGTYLLIMVAGIIVFIALNVFVF
jgi:NADH-quinone oxidoreductase subunit L